MKRPKKLKKRVFQKKQWSMEKFQEQKEQDQREQTWVNHYCSDHQILLVGDGDFSFSLSLAKGFGSASNMVASSFDTYGLRSEVFEHTEYDKNEVTKKYKNAKSNLEELQKLGACLLHGVDATVMKSYPDLNMRRFDRIIFNFPHAGFHGKEDSMSMIKMHMDLVFGFFKNASHMLRADGEIHVNHKTTPPFSNWNIEKLAEQSFMMMIACVDFNKEDYPGYNNKRGDSYRCDDPFPLGKCSTFKFINNPRSLKNHLRRNHMEVSVQQMTNLPFQEIHNIERFLAPADLNYHPQTRPAFQNIQNTEQFPAPVYLNYQPRTRLREIQNMEQFPAPVGHNYHPHTRPQFQEIHKTEQFPAPVGHNYHPQTRPQFQEIQKTEQFPVPVGHNYHPQTRPQFQEIQKTEQFPAPVGHNYHPQTRPQFQEIHKTEQFPAPVGHNYHPQTRPQFQEIHKTEQFPAPVGHNYHPQTRSQFQEIQKTEQFPTPDPRTTWINFQIQLVSMLKSRLGVRDVQ